VVGSVFPPLPHVNVCGAWLNARSPTATTTTTCAIAAVRAPGSTGAAATASHRNFVHAPISLPGWHAPLDVRAVGSDGSLWASTWTDVIHVHSDGRVHKIVLAPPILVKTAIPQAYPLTMARDGAVWVNASKLFRISNDDRVAVIDLPNYEGWTRGPSFGSDNTRGRPSRERTPVSRTLPSLRRIKPRSS